MFLASATLLSMTGIRPPLVCPLRALTGIPCPFCGTTTSVLAAMRLRPRQALAANPAGLLVVLAAGCIVVRRPREIRLPSARLVAAAVAALWLLQLRRLSPVALSSYCQRR